MGALNNSSHDITIQSQPIDVLVQNDSLDVYIQDQTTDIIDYYCCIDIASITLAQVAVIDSYDLVLTSVVGVVAGTYVCLQEGLRAFQAKILSIASNTLTLDTPIDFAFTVACTAANRSPDLNIDGSGTPVVGSLKPIAGVEWDITRIIGIMNHTGTPDDGLFGDITSLTRGMVVRKTNGVHHTIFNAKNNGQIKERTGPTDVTYSAAAPSGQKGTGFRRTFSGQAKNGVTIRLIGNDGDALEVIIQDDLTDLLYFRIVAQGHVVED